MGGHRLLSAKNSIFSQETLSINFGFDCGDISDIALRKYTLAIQDKEADMQAKSSLILPRALKRKK